MLANAYDKILEKINFENRNQKNWISGITNPVSRKTIAVISPYFDQKLYDSRFKPRRFKSCGGKITNSFSNWAKVNIRDRRGYVSVQVNLETWIKVI